MCSLRGVQIIGDNPLLFVVVVVAAAVVGRIFSRSFVPAGRAVKGNKQRYLSCSLALLNDTETLSSSS